MKLIAWMLIIIGLVAAIVSAVTAYTPKTSNADESFVTRDEHGDAQPLTLGAPAGRSAVSATQPVARAGEKLTPELLAQLRASEQRRVRVKEFSFARWSEAWIFGLGCLGMLAGALLIRREAGRELAATAQTGAGRASGSADEELPALRAELDELRRDVAATREPGVRMERIVERAERIISDHVPPFLDARAELVSRLGLAGYAQLMDRFAAGERQLNRAWSAAADGYEEEAVACLDNAAVLFEEAEKRMK
jgi:hypothetical protein